MKNKKLWTIVLIVSIILFMLLSFPPMEAYFGIDVPFVTIKDQTFTIFGYDVVGYEKQWGVMLLCGVLMMLPARTISLAIVKLQEK